MGIGKAPSIGAADTDVTPVKKKVSRDTILNYLGCTFTSAQWEFLLGDGVSKSEKQL